MRKSKSLSEGLCFCREYRLGEARLKTLMLQKIGSNDQQEQFGAERVLNMLFQFCDKKQAVIDEADALLRSCLKQDPTVKYSEQDGLSAMIQTLTAKLKKEREVHHLVLGQQEQTVAEYQRKVKEGEEEIAYLKELLNEEQMQLEVWKAEAQDKDRAIDELKQELSMVGFENQQLKQIQNKHSEKVTTLNNRINILETDKHKLSRHCLERAQDIAALVEHFQNLKQSMQYKIKVETNEVARLRDSVFGHGRYPSKKEMMEQLRSLSLTRTSQMATTDKYDRSSSSLGRKKQVDDDCHFYSVLSKSISTANPQTSRLEAPLDKSISLDCIKQHLFSHLFVGDVLYGQDEYRYDLVSVLQQCHNTIITRTRLLYKWEVFNHINIHKFVDGHPHVLFLIKTAKGQCIGAYSQAPFLHRSISNQLGLLIAFNQGLVFRNVKKSIMYDEKDIIFGNYDLKVRGGDIRVSSYLGAADSYYDSLGYSVKELLGEGVAKEVRIGAMEAFEVFFQS